MHRVKCRRDSFWTPKLARMGQKTTGERDRKGPGELTALKGAWLGCAVSRTMVSLAQPGGTERKVPGSPADLMWKHKGNNSMPRTQWAAQDVRG
jgi:hypothetical protein